MLCLYPVFLNKNSMGKAINRFCIPFLFALLACTNETKQLDIALQQAKDNKEELEKVLTHFENDSLKYRAACFLIENMPGKYSILPYDSLDRYKNFLKIIPQNDPISWDVTIF